MFLKEGGLAVDLEDYFGPNQDREGSLLNVRGHGEGAGSASVSEMLQRT